MEMSDRVFERESGWRRGRRLFRVCRCVCVCLCVCFGRMRDGGAEAGPDGRGCRVASGDDGGGGKQEDSTGKQRKGGGDDARHSQRCGGRQRRSCVGRSASLPPCLSLLCRCGCAGGWFDRARASLTSSFPSSAFGRAFAACVRERRDRAGERRQGERNGVADIMSMRAPNKEKKGTRRTTET